MEHKIINDWADLCKLLAEYDPRHQAGFIFRGVRKASYELIPGIGRKGNLRDGHILSTPTYRNYLVDDEVSLLSRFKLAARPFTTVAPGEDLEWMAIAQHHSLHTRLLDWSESPLVAAFFAAEQPSEKEDVAIYAAPKPPPIGEESPFHIQDVKLYRPAHLSARISAQSALFTVHPKPNEPWNPPELIKYTIPYGQCLLIKRRLMHAGISRAALFPDIDGLAQTLNWRYKWNWGLD